MRVLVEKKEEVLVEEKKEELPEQKEIHQDVADDDDDDEEEEDELVDPIDALRIACSQDAESRALLTVLNQCTERVESREMTEETCQQVKKIIFFVELFVEINLLLFFNLIF